MKLQKALIDHLEEHPVPCRESRLAVVECLLFITGNACDSYGHRPRNYVIILMGSLLIVWRRHQRIVGRRLETALVFSLSLAAVLCSF
jgi:hypothetical protein